MERVVIPIKKRIERIAGGPAFLDIDDVMDLKKAFARLAAYEDTMPLERAQELAQAEKDGRLAVLPCKVGDTVYRVITTRDNDPLITEMKIKTLGQAADLIGRIGEKRMLISWYLTLEEAEAALKKKEDLK